MRAKWIEQSRKFVRGSWSDASSLVKPGFDREDQCACFWIGAQFRDRLCRIERCEIASLAPECHHEKFQARLIARGESIGHRRFDEWSQLIGERRCGGRWRRQSDWPISYQSTHEDDDRYRDPDDCNGCNDRAVVADRECWLCRNRKEICAELFREFGDDRRIHGRESDGGRSIAVIDQRTKIECAGDRPDEIDSVTMLSGWSEIWREVSHPQNERRRKFLIELRAKQFASMRDRY